MVQTARQKKREENRALWAAREAERKKGKPTAAKRNTPAPAPAPVKETSPARTDAAPATVTPAKTVKEPRRPIPRRPPADQSVDKEIDRDIIAQAKEKGFTIPETVEGRARVIQKMIAGNPNLAYGDIVERVSKAWGVTEPQIRVYWTRAFERFKELGDLEPSATRGRLIDMAFDIASANKVSDPTSALNAMKMVASLLGLDKLAVERLSLDIQRYTRAMQIEEEKLRILGGGGDGPFLPDGFEDKMTAAAEKVLSRGTVIEGDVVPGVDPKE
jgi:hypothetical protein